VVVGYTTTEFLSVTITHVVDAGGSVCNPTGNVVKGAIQTTIQRYNSVEGVRHTT